MVLTNVLIVDTKTGKQERKKKDVTLPPHNKPDLKTSSGDWKKLKTVLKAKGIITKESEVE